MPPQYINNLHIIPCGVRDISLKSYNRIGDNGNSQYGQIWIFTGSMQNNDNENIIMGYAASSSTFPAESEGTGTHQYSISITGSNTFTPNSGDELICVALINASGSGTQAWRFNYRLDGITTE